jgi:hypothetical protein
MNDEKMRALSPAIRKAQDKLEQADRELHATIFEEIGKCPHPNVGEALYSSSSFSTSPPFRVCLDCGLAEDGWGAGYRILTARLVYNLTRDQAFDIRTCHISSDDKDKVFYRDRSMTLTQLLKSKLGIKNDD